MHDCVPSRHIHLMHVEKVSEFKPCFQGTSIKNLEAGPDGHVSGVKLENGSTIEADTVIWKKIFIF